MASENTNTNETAATRFTLVVENVFSVDENVSIAAVGNLHGKINKGDRFYIIHPGFPAGITASAETLVVDQETPDSAEECRLAIKITDISDPKRIPKYSVISNIAPQVRADPSKPLENPYLVGLSMEYNRLVKDNEFTYAFMVALLTSRYVTPAEMQLEEPDENGKVQLKDAKISFRLLRNPANKEQLALPVFTDNSALRLWKGALEPNANGEKPKTVIFPFERCAEVGKQNGGIVVNPFGPAPVLISNQNIENTLKLGKQIVERMGSAQAGKETK